MQQQPPSRMTELSESEFFATMNTPMSNVTDIADAVVNIWPYVRQLVEVEILPLPVLQNCLVEGVYRDATNQYDHVLLPTAESMVVIGLVIDRSVPGIIGYYRMDVGDEYGPGE